MNIWQYFWDNKHAENGSWEQQESFANKKYKKREKKQSWAQTNQPNIY